MDIVRHSIIILDTLIYGKYYTRSKVTGFLCNFSWYNFHMMSKVLSLIKATQLDMGGTNIRVPHRGEENKK